MRTSTPRRHGRPPGSWPIATVSVLAVTVALTVLQYPFPRVRLALWRDPELIAAGQWWRLVTALFVQYDAVWQIVVVFALKEDNHGPPLLVGFAVGALLLWRDRRRQLSGMVAAAGSR